MTKRFGVLLGLGLVLGAGVVIGLGYDDTPFYPGSKWRVHDGTRPQPPVVTPGPAVSVAPPSDAVVLFDGTNTDAWRAGDGKPCTFKVADGAMTVGGGDAWTKQSFGDCQLHVEWSSPNPPNGTDQGRGNSGVFLCGDYEIQVLDCYENKTYADGMAAAIYGQFPPLANVCRKPGEWNSYDILWTAPRFKGEAGNEVETPAYFTVLFNGVVVHNHTAPKGPMRFRALSQYQRHDVKGPIHIQDHGNPVRYRNIWVRELKGYDEG
ncbi:MAG: DUF1080 domain-containing protein [Armatimonadetes bacterium]|nr:DUF1080 domain-containing protein [Armatimonadota bacterium]